MNVCVHPSHGRNEAAERLLDWIEKAFADPVIDPVTYRAMKPMVQNTMRNALAAERRATVERIRERLTIVRNEGWSAGGMAREIAAILDEEAADR